LGINDYSIFSGAAVLPSNHQPIISTFTHRIIQSFHAISRENNKLLTKGGRLASIVHSTFFMPLESFQYLRERLCESFPGITTSNTLKRNKHQLLHGNLSLERTLQPTDKVTILAQCQNTFAAVRGVLSNQMGIGVRKRAPTLKVMYQRAKNPDTLKSTDTINIIEDIFGETEISDSWLDEDAIGLDDYQSTGRNLIKLVYDSRLNTCRMSMVCYAVKG
jgi:hypothetical protein